MPSETKMTKLQKAAAQEGLRLVEVDDGFSLLDNRDNLIFHARERKQGSLSLPPGRYRTAVQAIEGFLRGELEPATYVWERS